MDTDAALKIAVDVLHQQRHDPRHVDAKRASEAIKELDKLRTKEGRYERQGKNLPR